MTKPISLLCGRGKVNKRQIADMNATRAGLLGKKTGRVVGIHLCTASAILALNYGNEQTLSSEPRLGAGPGYLEATMANRLNQADCRETVRAWQTESASPVRHLMCRKRATPPAQGASGLVLVFFAASWDYAWLHQVQIWVKLREDSG